MTRLLNIAFAMLLLPLGINAQTELKVVTFNIRSFEPDFKVEPYAEYLATEAPDIICLNEVENRSTRQVVNNKTRDLVQELAMHLKMFGLFGYSYNLDNKKGQEPESKYKYCLDYLYGNAILSKYPILNIESMQLPRPEGSADQRGVVTAEIMLPTGKMIRVACTHLDHIGGQQEQANVLLTDKVLSNSIPTILCGDMNVGVGSGVVNTITTKYDRLCGNERTYQSGSKLDYVFGSKGDFETVETHVKPRSYNGKELSDHHPLVVTMKLK